MTKQEFIPGWTLLIVQPWGWRYNQIGKDNKPTPDALVQLDFYYEKLKWAQPQAWLKVASDYAQGKEWPSITELRQSLQHVNGQFISALPKPERKGEPMPDAVRQKVSGIGKAMPEQGNVKEA